jgi:hypothetical protein
MFPVQTFDEARHDYAGYAGTPDTYVERIVGVVTV